MYLLKILLEEIKTGFTNLSTIGVSLKNKPALPSPFVSSTLGMNRAGVLMSIWKISTL